MHYHTFTEPFNTFTSICQEYHIRIFEHSESGTQKPYVVSSDLLNALLPEHAIASRNRAIQCVPRSQRKVTKIPGEVHHKALLSLHGALLTCGRSKSENAPYLLWWLMEQIKFLPQNSIPSEVFIEGRSVSGSIRIIKDKNAYWFFAIDVLKLILPNHKNSQRSALLHRVNERGRTTRKIQTETGLRLFTLLRFDGLIQYCLTCNQLQDSQPVLDWIFANFEMSRRKTNGKPFPADGIIIDRIKPKEYKSFVSLPEYKNTRSAKTAESLDISIRDYLVRKFSDRAEPVSPAKLNHLTRILSASLRQARGVEMDTAPSIIQSPADLAAVEDALKIFS